MRLVELAEKFVAERGADTQAVAASQEHGSTEGGLGGRIGHIERLEQDGSTGVRGGVCKVHPTLSDLKRYLWAKNGPAKNAKSILGRD